MARRELQENAYQRTQHLLEREDEDGRPVWSRDDQDHLIAALSLVALAHNPKAALTPMQEAAVQRCLQQAGISGSRDADSVERGLRAYFEAHPIRKDLLSEMLVIVREQKNAGTEATRIAAERFFGATSPQRQQASGEGVTGGILAQGRLNRKLDNN